MPRNDCEHLVSKFWGHCDIVLGKALQDFKKCWPYSCQGGFSEACNKYELHLNQISQPLSGIHGLESPLTLFILAQALTCAG